MKHLSLEKLFELPCKIQIRDSLPPMLRSFLLSICLLMSNLVFANDMIIDADEVLHNLKKSTVTANGNVVVKKIMEGGTSILYADSIIYDTLTKVITAQGNVELKKASGEIFRGQKLNLQDDFASLVVEQFNAILSNNSFVTAKHAHKKEGKIILKNSTYSTCSKDCNDLQQWSFYASSSEIDEEKEVMIHRNVFFRIYGVPVFYSPFLMHATPGAEARSGFLIPSYASSDYNGFEVYLPHYYHIDVNRELITTMRYMSKEDNPLLSFEYAHLFKNAEIKLKSSFTKNEDYIDLNGQHVDESRFRGHLDWQGTWRMSPNWYSEFHLRKSSDFSYLKKYGFGEDAYLNSDLYFNYANGLNYGQIKSLFLQDLTTHNRLDKDPQILPLINYHHEFSPIGFAMLKNAHFESDFSLMSLNRNKNNDFIDRISLNNALIKPIYYAGNDVRLKLSVDTDLYSIKGDFLDYKNQKHYHEHDISRITPSLELRWKRRFWNYFKKTAIVLEPVLNFNYSKIYGTAKTRGLFIPNEDSPSLDLSASNVFSANRFSGFDRKEYGKRVNYGVNLIAKTDSNQKYRALIGQAYYFDDPGDAKLIRGIDKGFSDYVTMLHWQSNSGSFKGWEIYNFMRLNVIDQNSSKFAIKKNQIGHIGHFNLPSLKLKNSYDVSYIFQNKNMSEISRSVKISTNFMYDNYLKVSLYASKDLGSSYLKDRKNKIIDMGSKITYDAECVSVDFSVDRNFLQDSQSNLGPSLKYKLQFFLKHIN